jgi:hypothetical protein
MFGFMAGARSRRHGRGERERRGRDEVVGEALGEARHEVGRGGRDEQELAPAAELDVVHARRGASAPNSPPRPARPVSGLEELRGHELGRARREQRAHQMALLGELAREVAGLVQRGRGAAGEQDARH